MKSLIKKLLREGLIKETTIKTLLYHGTKHNFDKFDLKFFNAGSGDGGWLGRGVYLTNDYEYAESYGNVLECKVNIKNPYIITDFIYSRSPEKLANDLGVNNSREITSKLIKEGYDSVILTYSDKGYTKDGEYDKFIEICVFDPNNVEVINRIGEGVNMTTIDEAAFTSTHLPEGTGLFIEENNSGASLTLYNPKNKETYATITFISHISEGPFHWVSGVAAEKGFGPLIYELAFMYIHEQNSKLMPSRDGNVRGGAFNVWEKMYKRNDVNKIEFDVENNNFRFDIITGEESRTTPEERLGWFDELTANEQFTLKVFNAAYSKTPTKEYKELINIAHRYPEKIHDKAHAEGDLLWQSSYD